MSLVEVERSYATSQALWREESGSDELFFAALCHVLTLRRACACSFIPTHVMYPINSPGCECDEVGLWMASGAQVFSPGAQRVVH